MITDRGTVGTIKWALDIQGPALDLFGRLAGRSAANGLIRDSLISAGTRWIAGFLPKRFSNYVERSPFSYRLRSPLQKFRALGLLKPIFDREFFGWDPWSPANPPKQWIAIYARGRTSRTGMFSGIKREARRNAKRITREIVDDQSAKIVPLVQTGLAQRAALTGAQARATATASRKVLRIAVPLGAARNEKVGKIIRTIPPHEVAAIARWVEQSVVARLSGRGIESATRLSSLPTTRSPHGGQ